NPVLTIGRQLTEGIEMHLGYSRRKARHRAVELLDLVGIPSPRRRLDDYPHQLSGGMRQRVMIAMALSCEPQLILADEITTALDATIQAQILDLLTELSQSDQTSYVLITHDLGIVARMTQQVNVMYAGRIVEAATTPELFANPQMPYTWGLLASVPRLDEETKERLTPIEGAPPDLTADIPGCPFAPRCRYSRPICSEQVPPLSEVAPGHLAACWGTKDVEGGGWLRGHDWRADESTPITISRSGQL
ncbi:MAG TPA: ABC transporter ATP-binding protein, partial [Acidimicrobiia bacterium]|nr:ABC transporter ATP-binding protein [Acidimicrobiia bacterium]